MKGWKRLKKDRQKCSADEKFFQETWGEFLLSVQLQTLLKVCSDTRTYMHIRTHTSTNTHTNKKFSRQCQRRCQQTATHACIYAHIQAHIHADTHTYKHTYTHIQAHIHTQTRNFSKRTQINFSNKGFIIKKLFLWAFLVIHWFHWIE